MSKKAKKSLSMLNRLVGSLRYLIDKRYVSKVYKESYGRELDWSNPTRFSEKINILKISPEISKIADYTDKYKVRDYVAKKIGEKYLVPIIGVYNSPDEMDYASLPSRFVLKCTHGSGMNLICKNKRTFDWKSAKRQLKIWQRSNYYHTFGRELQYNYITPRIICENYLENSDQDLIDYKFYCFSGKPDFVRVMVGRQGKLRKSTYDLNWHKPAFDFIDKYNDSDWRIPRPKNLQTMIRLASTLSAGLTFVRVDLYNIDGVIYFGELTFTPAAGIQFFEPREFDILYGSKIKSGLIY